MIAVITNADKGIDRLGNLDKSTENEWSTYGKADGSVSQIILMGEYAWIGCK
jgi:hypothetical protein